MALAVTRNVTIYVTFYVTVGKGSESMIEKFKKTEYTLYNYRSLDIKNKNIKIDIENLKNDITLKAVGYEERVSPTNAFSSSVENEVIRREEHIQEKIDRLEAKLKYNQDLKIKIEGALQQLTEQELKLVKLRYFSKEKKTWLELSTEIGFDKDYCIKIKNRVINKLSEFIYP